jgi:hypothetical protein
MTTSRVRRRSSLLVVVGVVAALGIAAVLPRGNVPPIAAAVAATGDCAGPDGSMNCFQLGSIDTIGNLGSTNAAGDTFENSAVQSFDTRSGTEDWTALKSADGTFITLRNARANNFCLRVTSGIVDGKFVGCASATRFRLKASALTNVATFASVDTVGYCLRDLGKRTDPNGIEYAGGTTLYQCGQSDGQEFQISGPIAGTAANWPRKLALELAFANCNTTPKACAFEADSPNVEPALSTRAAGCLKTINNSTSTSTTTASVAYATTVQSAQKLGASKDQTVGVEFMLEGNGATTTFGWNAYQNNTFTHVNADTSTYSVTVPPKMFGWLADTE